MVEVKKILCPTDFSEFSDWALELALPLARWYRSEITIAHVVPRVLMHPEYFPYMQEPVLPSPDVRQQAEEELNRFAEKARKAGVATQARLAEGDSVEQVLEIASELPADLMVMGTHGRRGFERLVLGSVTEKVLRKAACPVLTVSQAPKKTREGQGEGVFHNILCPLDFSPPSVKALQFAVSLAREARSCLTTLHVLESLFELLGPSVTSSRLARLESQALDKMAELIPPEAAEACRPERLVLRGRSYEQILRAAEERAADLIVMGVHGRRSVDVMLFGSTTHQVVRGASCPVLTIPSL